MKDNTDKTLYVHKAYANDANGQDFTKDATTNRSYLGQYQDFNEASSDNPKDYSWQELAQPTEAPKLKPLIPAWAKWIIIVIAGINMPSILGSVIAGFVIAGAVDLINNYWPRKYGDN